MSNQSGSRRVVVTGMGVVTPIGNDVPTFWPALLAGTSGAARIVSFDTSDLEVQIGAEVKGFEPSQRLDPKLVRRTDRFVQLGLWAADEAVKTRPAATLLASDVVEALPAAFRRLAA